LKRVVEKEQFYTSRDFANTCVQLVDRHFPLSHFGTIVEPSAGTGVFVDILSPFNVEAVDIDPKHPKVRQCDFLTWLPTFTPPVLFVGNPPFGQRSSLAVKFVERACELGDVVAFILPRSFRKYTFINRIDPQFHLVDQIDGQDFVDRSGNAIEVKTVFQIWERRDTTRPKIDAPTSHPDFLMRHAHLSRTSESNRKLLVQKYPFAIAQAGGNFLPRESSLINRGSWWFIAPRDANVTERFHRLDFSFCDNMNVAHTSLSKSDIIRAYEEALALDLSKEQVAESAK